jgi:hypothetical protein
MGVQQSSSLRRNSFLTLLGTNRPATEVAIFQAKFCPADPSLMMLVDPVSVISVLL